MKNPLFRWASVALILPLALVACSKPPPAEEPLRAVKLMTVTVGTIGSEPEFLSLIHI